MKPSGTWFSHQIRSRRLGVDVREASRWPRGSRARPTPWARPHPHGPLVAPPTYFFLLYIYPRTPKHPGAPRKPNSRIRFLAPVLIIWGYVCIYRRKKNTGGATRGPWGKGARPRGGRPPPSWPPLLFLGAGSKSPGSRSVRKSRSRRFYSVWTPLIFRLSKTLK